MRPEIILFCLLGNGQRGKAAAAILVLSYCRVTLAHIKQMV